MEKEKEEKWAASNERIESITLSGSARIVLSEAETKTMLMTYALREFSANFRHNNKQKHLAQIYTTLPYTLLPLDPSAMPAVVMP